MNITKVTAEHQKWLRIGTNRIKALFWPEGPKKPWPKPSAGARIKPRVAECCPNKGFL